MHHFIVVFFIFLITLPAFKDYWLNILILKFGKKKTSLARLQNPLTPWAIGHNFLCTLPNEGVDFS